MSAAPAQKWYPAQPAPAPKASRKVARPAKLRESLVPGTVLIILAGRFRGKRVVYLRSLGEGTLLVSGPFKINGVPLRRVNARYVIATSTKIDISSVASAAEKVDASFFARDKKTEAKATEEELFGDAPVAKKEISADRLQAQKTIDAGLVAEIKKTPLLKEYIKSSFSLKKGDRPHLLKF